MAASVTQLTIARLDNLTKLYGVDFAPCVWVGSQYDNEAHALEFVRDPEYVNQMLVLYFDGALVVLGRKNTFTIPALLTQMQTNHLQVAFIRDNMVMEHSNCIELIFHPSLSGCKTRSNPILDVAPTAVGFTGQRVARAVDSTGKSRFG